MLQNAPNCIIQKKIFGEACPRTPLANAWHAPPPLQKKVGPLLAKPVYAHGQLLRNLFEEQRS